MALNPEILGRPLFPSTQRTGEILQGLGRSLTNAITPSAGTPPATMAGVSIPPAGASLGQLQFTGPLINTSRFDQQAAPQPSQSAQPTFDYGTFAATRGLPTFDVTKTQTPSAAQSQINAGILTGQNRPSSFSVSAQQPFAVKQPVQPRIDTAVREGTISATPQQLANLNARTTAFEGRTPEQQQALLAQMRERGAALAAQQTETMKTFAESRGARFAPMPAPQGRFGQPLTGLFPQSKEAIAQRTEPRGMERLAAFPSAIGFTEMQKQQASAMPPQIRNQSLFGGMGYSSVFGGPQPTSSMVAAGPIEEQIRKRIFGTI